MMDAARPLDDIRLELGETPLWSNDEQALYWIDCHAPAFYRRDMATGETMCRKVESRIGGMVLRQGGGIVAALATGIFSFESLTSPSVLVASPPYGPSHIYLHEARADPHGRLWVGMINMRHTEGEEGGAQVHKLVSGILVEQEITRGGSVSNGMAWSRAGDIFYYADTMSRRVWKFACDPATGMLSDRRLFMQFDEVDGYPDGATVDNDGGYWVAMYGTGQIIRLTPDGSRDRLVEVPSKFPTAVNFGGPSLDRLFVTTANLKREFDGGGWSDADGRIFEIDVGGGTVGLPEPRVFV